MEGWGLDDHGCGDRQWVCWLYFRVRNKQGLQVTPVDKDWPERLVGDNVARFGGESKLWTNQSAGGLCVTRNKTKDKHS